MDIRESLGDGKSKQRWSFGWLSTKERCGMRQLPPFECSGLLWSEAGPKYKTKAYFISQVVFTKGHRGHPTQPHQYGVVK